MAQVQEDARAAIEVEAFELHATEAAAAEAQPRWVPIGGLSLIAVGVLIIILSYIVPGVLPFGNYALIAGFVLMALGLLLSQWR